MSTHNGSIKPDAEAHSGPCLKSSLKYLFQNSQQLVVVDDFRQKSSVLDVWKGPEYTSAIGTLVRNKLSAITA